MQLVVTMVVVHVVVLMEKRLVAGTGAVTTRPNIVGRMAPVLMIAKVVVTRVQGTLIRRHLVTNAVVARSSATLRSENGMRRSLI